MVNRWFIPTLLTVLCLSFLVFSERRSSKLEAFNRTINFPIDTRVVYDLDFSQELLCGGYRLVDGWLISQEENLLRLFELSSLKRYEPDKGTIRVEITEFMVGIAQIRDRFPDIDLYQISFFYLINSKTKIYAIVSNKGEWAYTWGKY